MERGVYEQRLFYTAFCREAFRQVQAADLSLGRTLETLRNILALPSRIRHRWKNRRRLVVSASLQRTLKANCDKAKAHNLPTYVGIYNVGLFIAVAEQDVSTYSEAIVFARSEWHRKFHARGLAVLLLELSEDLPELLGKKYRNWLSELELGSEWTERLNNIGRQLSSFRKEHTPFLRRVRNYIGAHRDHDASTQLELIDSLDVLEVFRLGALLSVPLRGLMDFYTDLLAHMGRPSVILGQFGRRGEA